MAKSNAKPKDTKKLLAEKDEFQKQMGEEYFLICVYDLAYENTQPVKFAMPTKENPPHGFARLMEAKKESDIGYRTFVINLDDPTVRWSKDLHYVGFKQGSQAFLDTGEDNGFMPHDNQLNESHPWPNKLVRTPLARRKSDSWNTKGALNFTCDPKNPLKKGTISFDRSRSNSRAATDRVVGENPPTVAAAAPAAAAAAAPPSALKKTDAQLLAEAKAYVAKQESGNAPTAPVQPKVIIKSATFTPTALKTQQSQQPASAPAKQQNQQSAPNSNRRQSRPPRRGAQAPPSDSDTSATSSARPKSKRRRSKTPARVSHLQTVSLRKLDKAYVGTNPELQGVVNRPGFTFTDVCSVDVDGGDIYDSGYLSTHSSVPKFLGVPSTGPNFMLDDIDQKHLGCGAKVVVIAKVCVVKHQDLEYLPATTTKNLNQLVSNFTDLIHEVGCECCDEHEKIKPDASLKPSSQFAKERQDKLDKMHKKIHPDCPKKGFKYLDIAKFEGESAPYTFECMPDPEAKVIIRTDEPPKSNLPKWVKRSSKWGPVAVDEDWGEVVPIKYEPTEPKVGNGDLPPIQEAVANVPPESAVAEAYTDILPVGEEPKVGFLSESPMPTLEPVDQDIQEDDTQEQPWTDTNLAAYHWYLMQNETTRLHIDAEMRAYHEMGFCTAHNFLAYCLRRNIDVMSQYGGWVNLYPLGIPFLGFVDHMPQHIKDRYNPAVGMVDNELPPVVVTAGAHNLLRALRLIRLDYVGGPLPNDEKHQHISDDDMPQATDDEPEKEHHSRAYKAVVKERRLRREAARMAKYEQESTPPPRTKKQKKFVREALKAPLVPYSSSSESDTSSDSSFENPYVIIEHRPREVYMSIVHEYEEFLRHEPGIWFQDWYYASHWCFDENDDCVGLGVPLLVEPPAAETHEVTIEEQLEDFDSDYEDRPDFATRFFRRILGVSDYEPGRNSPTPPETPTLTRQSRTRHAERRRWLSYSLWTLPVIFFLTFFMMVLLFFPVAKAVEIPPAYWDYIRQNNLPNTTDHIMGNLSWIQSTPEEYQKQTCPGLRVIHGGHSSCLHGGDLGNQTDYYKSKWTPDFVRGLLADNKNLHIFRSPVFADIDPDIFRMFSKRVFNFGFSKHDHDFSDRQHTLDTTCCLPRIKRCICDITRPPTKYGAACVAGTSCTGTAYVNLGMNNMHCRPPTSTESSDEPSYRWEYRSSPNGLNPPFSYNSQSYVKRANHIVYAYDSATKEMKSTVSDCVDMEGHRADLLPKPVIRDLAFKLQLSMTYFGSVAYCMAPGWGYVSGNPSATYYSDPVCPDNYDPIAMWAFPLTQPSVYMFGPTVKAITTDLTAVRLLELYSSVQEWNIHEETSVSRDEIIPFQGPNIGPTTAFSNGTSVAVIVGFDPVGLDKEMCTNAIMVDIHRDTPNTTMVLSPRQSYTLSNPSVVTVHDVLKDDALFMTPVCQQKRVKKTFYKWEEDPNKYFIYKRVDDDYHCDALEDVMVNTFSNHVQSKQLYRKCKRRTSPSFNVTNVNNTLVVCNNGTKPVSLTYRYHVNVRGEPDVKTLQGCHEVDTHFLGDVLIRDDTHVRVVPHESELCHSSGHFVGDIHHLWSCTNNLSVGSQVLIFLGPSVTVFYLLSLIFGYFHLWRRFDIYVVRVDMYFSSRSRSNRVRKYYKILRFFFHTFVAYPVKLLSIIFRITYWFSRKLWQIVAVRIIKLFFRLVMLLTGKAVKHPVIATGGTALATFRRVRSEITLTCQTNVFNSLGLWNCNGLFPKSGQIFYINGWTPRTQRILETTHIGDVGQFTTIFTLAGYMDWLPVILLTVSTLATAYFVYRLVRFVLALFLHMRRNVVNARTEGVEDDPETVVTEELPAVQRVRRFRSPVFGGRRARAAIHLPAALLYMMMIMVVNASVNENINCEFSGTVISKDYECQPFVVSERGIYESVAWEKGFAMKKLFSASDSSIEQLRTWVSITHPSLGWWISISFLMAITVIVRRFQGKKTLFLLMCFLCVANSDAAPVNVKHVGQDEFTYTTVMPIPMRPGFSVDIPVSHDGYEPKTIRVRYVDTYTSYTFSPQSHCYHLYHQLALKWNCYNNDGGNGAYARCDPKYFAPCDDPCPKIHHFAEEVPATDTYCLGVNHNWFLTMIVTSRSAVPPAKVGRFSQPVTTAILEVNGTNIITSGDGEYINSDIKIQIYDTQAVVPVLPDTLLLWKDRFYIPRAGSSIYGTNQVCQYTSNTEVTYPACENTHDRITGRINKALPSAQEVVNIYNAHHFKRDTSFILNTGTFRPSVGDNGVIVPSNSLYVGWAYGEAALTTTEWEDYFAPNSASLEYFDNILPAGCKLRHNGLRANMTGCAGGYMMAIFSGKLRLNPIFRHAKLTIDKSESKPCTNTDTSVEIVLQVTVQEIGSAVGIYNEACTPVTFQLGNPGLVQLNLKCTLSYGNSTVAGTIAGSHFRQAVNCTYAKLRIGEKDAVYVAADKHSKDWHAVWGDPSGFFSGIGNFLTSIPGTIKIIVIAASVIGVCVTIIVIIYYIWRNNKMAEAAKSK